MDRRRVPLYCALLALVLAGVATRLYPGFDWWRNYLTQLFRPVAANGAENGARPYAIAGMWVFCVGMAELFRQLAAGMASTWHGKWVRIFGIATMVYAALTVTRMHDLMVTIAVAFFAGAQVVLLDWLWRRRRRAEFIAGIVNLALALAADFVYYRYTVTAALPTLQKLVFLCSVAWLLRLQRTYGVSGKPKV